MPRTEDEYVCEILRQEPLLRAYLHRFAPQHPDLEDLLQETYSRLFGLSAERRTDVENVQAFAVTVARNIVTDWVRRQRIVPIDDVGDVAALPVVDGAADVEAIVHSHQQLVRIADAIATLPERCRQVFTLRRVYGFSQKEIANRLGVTEGTVEQHLIKGVRRCAEIMNAHEATGPATSASNGWLGRWRRKVRMQRGQG